MLVAVTGTPGVGKTTVCQMLKKEYTVIDVNSFAKEHGCFEDYDDAAGSYNVDTDKLGGLLQEYRNDDVVIMDGHLSHYIDCDMIIVLRCEPKILSKRLELRKYDSDKVRENVQAEILDVILSESVENNKNTFEIDCSHMGGEEICSVVTDIINNRDANEHLPGKVDWTEEMEEWF